MDLNTAIEFVGIALLAGAVIVQTIRLQRSLIPPECLEEERRRAASAEAERASADAVTAMLWLHVDPGMAPVYHRAVKIFGKETVDREMRRAVERGEWKLPEVTRN